MSVGGLLFLYLLSRNLKGGKRTLDGHYTRQLPWNDRGNLYPDLDIEFSITFGEVR